MTADFPQLAEKQMGVGPGLEQVVSWLTQELNQLFHLQKYAPVLARIKGVSGGSICTDSLTYFPISTLAMENVLPDEDKQEDAAQWPHVNSLCDGKTKLNFWSSEDRESNQFTFQKEDKG